MKLKKIDFDFDETLEIDNDNGCIDVNVILYNYRLYQIQVATAKCFVSPIIEENQNFLEAISPSIIVKELTRETIEEAVEFYLKKEGGFWLNFCHLST